jgi:hypothetical protein
MQMSCIRSGICDFILAAASLGMLHRPIVSDAILDEASRNVAISSRMIVH